MLLRSTYVVLVGFFDERIMVLARLRFDARRGVKDEASRGRGLWGGREHEMSVSPAL